MISPLCLPQTGSSSVPALPQTPRQISCLLIPPTPFAPYFTPPSPDPQVIIPSPLPDGREVRRYAGLLKFDLANRKIISLPTRHLFDKRRSRVCRECKLTGIGLQVSLSRYPNILWGSCGGRCGPEKVCILTSIRKEPRSYSSNR
jgi:hypothetical protein